MAKNCSRVAEVCAAAGLENNGEYVLAASGADSALASLDELGAKAKLQVWPQGHF